MKYDNGHVRRQDRLLEEENGYKLLEKGEYGVLSMIEDRAGESAGYGIPLNYVWDGKTSVYFHCAPQGHKLQILTLRPLVSFCVVGKTNVISHQFTTAYESIVVRGKIATNLYEEERRKALLMLLDKYSPNDKEVGIKYAEKSFHRTEIMRLDIIEISGKTKRITG